MTREESAVSRPTQTSRPDPTVGIVLVSHSAALARAAVALAAEMVHGRDLRIAVAAGLDETTFGTDAVRIKQAIEQIDSGPGVVVLMDLGSAVLSAELALDLLDDPERRDRVLLCPAPLVEGLVAAAVAASGGASRAEVAAEARSALLGKQSHLEPVPAGGRSAGEPTPPAVTAVFTVTNPHGLHARPAARLVSEVRTLDATVWLRNLSTGAGPVPAASLSQVATLGVLAGQQVEVSVWGAQAREALDHVLALGRRQFDERLGAVEPLPNGSRAAVAARSGPLPASPGVAVGPVHRLRTRSPMADASSGASSGPSAGGSPGGPAQAATEPAAEWRRLGEAVAAARRQVQRLRAVTAQELGEAEAQIFDAHLMLLDDPDLLGRVHQQVDAGVSAAAAWSDAVGAVERDLTALPDPYLRGRAADVRAVGDTVLAELPGHALTGQGPVVPDGDGVLVAADLTPALAAALDPDRVHGIVLAYGSPTSHAAVLARSRGIPAVVGAGPGVLSLAEGTTVALDGSTGELVLDPSAPVVTVFRDRAREQRRHAAENLRAARLPARTRDGSEIAVAANLGSVADAHAAVTAGAEEAGLVRTEFLFVHRERPPGVEEQEAMYRAIAVAMCGRRTTLRTLDVGGDKPLQYLAQPPEDNPFLGVRGIRLTLTHPALLLDQLLAILRVAHDHPIDLMFPMVSSLNELLAARRALADAAAMCGGLPETLRVGIMVEVPAVAMKLGPILPHVDFLSIGTNDLTQYALAADRGNGAVAALADPLDPGVLGLVERVCLAAVRGGVPVAVCGDAAADDAAVPLLLGLGVAELSVAPPAVPGVKNRVRGLDLRDCRALAAHALTLPDAAAVRAAVTSWPGQAPEPRKAAS
jgi:phosphoenolpyruvate-protein phosphotransferase/dihydroxyacetone kinase phosphotransfer subunit